MTVFYHCINICTYAWLELFMAPGSVTNRGLPFGVSYLFKVTIRMHTSLTLPGMETRYIR
jgi:hypothetical protein